MSAFGLTTIAPSEGRSSSSNKRNNMNGNGSGSQQQQQQQQQQRSNAEKNQKSNRNFSNNNKFQNNRTHQEQRNTSNPKSSGSGNSNRDNRKPKPNQQSRSTLNKPKDTPPPPPPPSSSATELASEPEYIVQTKLVPSKASILPPPSPIHDQFVGPLFKNPESLGFVRHPPKQQELPNYLIHEQKYLEKHEFNPDPWDIANQQKMLQLEQSMQDTNELMETLEEMRRVERQEMENKGLVDKANVSKSLADAIVFRGSCLYMCPVFEKIKRTINGDMSKYEKDPQTNKVVSAIKTFSRSEAGQLPQLPSDVRPPHVLVQTLDYMIDHLLDKLPESESFIWNRTRSIRQDFTYQNYFGPEAVYCIEKICRIHILTLHVMANSDVEYSQQQELEQLNKSLETLNEIYDDLRKIGRDSPNEAEFRAYYVLSYYKKAELNQMIQALPIQLYKNPLIQTAIMFRGYLLLNHTSDRDNLPNGFNFFTQFFKSVADAETPFLMSCLLEVHFNEVRFYALKSMSGAYHSGGKPYYAAQLAEMLGFDDDVGELVKFVEYYGLNTTMDNDQLCVYLSPFKFNYVKDKEKPKQAYSRRLNDKVEGKSYKEVVNSGMVMEQGREYRPSETELPRFEVPAIPAVPQVSQAQLEQERLRRQQLQQRQEAKRQQQLDIQQKQELERARQMQLQLQQQQQQKQAAMVPQRKTMTQLPSYPRAAEAVYTEFLSHHVHETLSSVVSSSVAHEKHRRERHGLISSLSEELYRAFMNEVIHLALLENEAAKFRDRSLKRSLIRVLKPVAARSLKSAETKLAKQREFEEFKHGGKRRVVSDAATMARELAKMKKKKMRIASTAMTGEIDYAELWRPLDLQAEFVEELMLRQQKAIKSSLMVLVVVKDWSELSSRWLMSKLGLRPNSAHTTFQNRLTAKGDNGMMSIKITGLPDQFSEKAYFRNSTFIVFEFGKNNSSSDYGNMERKLKFDKKVLDKVFEYSRANCPYKIAIVILVYDATKSGMPISKIENLLDLHKVRLDPHVNGVSVYDMAIDSDISQTLRTALRDAARSFQLLSTTPSPAAHAHHQYEHDIEDTTTNVSSVIDESVRARNSKRAEFLKATLQRQSLPRIHLRSSASFANTNHHSQSYNNNNNTTAGQVTFSKFNNNDLFQDITLDHTSTNMKPYISTSTPIATNHQQQRSVSVSGVKVGGDPKTKAMELRKLAASILQGKRRRD